jgi:hypothetical protein
MIHPRRSGVTDPEEVSPPARIGPYRGLSGTLIPAATRAQARISRASPENVPDTADWLAEGVEFELSGDFLNGQ